MKKLLLALLPLCTTISCAAGLVAIGAGVLIGAWIASDFQEGTGSVFLNVAPEDTFAAAVAEANSRDGASEIEVFRGSMRVEWVEDGARIRVAALIYPDNYEMTELRVSAQELGLKGRPELSQDIGEAISNRVK